MQQRGSKAIGGGLSPCLMATVVITGREFGVLWLVGNNPILVLDSSPNASAPKLHSYGMDKGKDLTYRSFPPHPICSLGAGLV